MMNRLEQRSSGEVGSASRGNPKRTLALKHTVRKKRGAASRRGSILDDLYLHWTLGKETREEFYTGQLLVVGSPTQLLPTLDNETSRVVAHWIHHSSYLVDRIILLSFKVQGGDMRKREGHQCRLPIIRRWFVKI
jgi:hypothetical protein